jgi:hypothetical protein
MERLRIGTRGREDIDSSFEGKSHLTCWLVDPFFVVLVVVHAGTTTEIANALFMTNWCEADAQSLRN